MTLKCTPCAIFMAYFTPLLFFCDIFTAYCHNIPFHFTLERPRPPLSAYDVSFTVGNEQEFPKESHFRRIRILFVTGNCVPLPQWLGLGRRALVRKESIIQNPDQRHVVKWANCLFNNISVLQ